MLYRKESQNDNQNDKTTQIMQDKTTANERHLQRIADILIINGALLENSGLWYGTTGVAIFLFHYAKYTGNALYEKFAVEIINAIQADIHSGSSKDYERGLAGIGTGIEYLSQNGFLDNDTNKTLVDFDNYIPHEIIYSKQENNSLADGLCGLGQYLLYRLHCRTNNTDEAIFLSNQEATIHVVNILENEENPVDNCLPDVISFLCRLYTLNICNPKINRYFDRFFKNFSFNDIPDEYLHVWSLSLLRMASIRNQSEELRCKIFDRTLQMMEIEESAAVEPMSLTDQLLWLLQCKRLILQTGISMDMVSRLDSLADKILNRTDELLTFEKGKLSLKGCAGIGLSMMTVTGRCDSAWLELLM